MTAKRWEYKRFRFSTIRLLGGALQTERQRIGATTSAHENVRIGDIYYNLNESAHTAEVTKGPNKYSGDIVIPSSVNYNGETYVVTSISYRAFHTSNVESIKIPDTVTSLGGAKTFYGCSYLTSVTIGNGVASIGEMAFSSCGKLTSVSIGSGVTTIGKDAFEYCYGLKKIIVKDIAAWCNIQFGDSESNPLNYGGHLYSDDDTEITNLVIPQGVTSISNYAFYNCGGLVSITIPSSLTSIGEYVFSYSSNLNAVYITDLIAWCRINFGSNPLSVAGHLFLNGAEVKDLVIPYGLTSINNAYS